MASRRGYPDRERKEGKGKRGRRSRERAGLKREDRRVEGWGRRGGGRRGRKKGGGGGDGGSMLESVNLSKGGTHIATGPEIMYVVPIEESAAFGATSFREGP